MPLSLLDNLANLIFMGAYWVKDILWLRLLAIVGSLVVIPYYLLQAEPLWPQVLWSCVFISIHIVRAWGIVKERRPVAFSGDERLLYDKTFSALSPHQFRRLVALGEWLELDRGQVLHSIGDPADTLEAVVRGEVEARRKGRVLGHARPGDLVGLACVLGDAPELYDATVTQPARLIRWRRTDLQNLAGSDEKMTSILRKIAAAALAENLIRAVHTDY
ncbi:MAG: Crp/Fnr family transcriptional regulator [Solirubrobacterales bacterium]